MRIASLTVVVIALAASGCGGSGEASAPVSTTDAPKASRSSRVGCDVAAQCATVNAQETLKRCPASRLDARGRKARKRLERLLARIERVDLHNKQVDEAYAAAMKALEELERTCI
jgi:hypothetical protein